MRTKSESLVYEVHNGKPIHYKGYQQVLNGTKKSEEITCKSYLQSLIISNLFFLLKSKLSPDFVTLTSEIGLKFDKNSRRAADIAIFEKTSLKKIKDTNKYLEIAPKYVIEVDIKASSNDIEDATSYYHKKTDELIKFGTEVVVWIFTESQKIMIAKKDSTDWKITNWDKTFSDIENISINIGDLAKL